MKKSYIIEVVNPVTGAYVLSKTNNVAQRIRRLKENIASINGNGTAVFERFKPFIGVDPEAAIFNVYKQIS